MHRDLLRHQVAYGLIVGRRKGQKTRLFVTHSDLFFLRAGLKVTDCDFQSESTECILSARHLDAPLPTGQAAALWKTTIRNAARAAKNKLLTLNLFYNEKRHYF